jgi:hypothetical protein
VDGVHSGTAQAVRCVDEKPILLFEPMSLFPRLAYVFWNYSIRLIGNTNSNPLCVPSGRNVVRDSPEIPSPPFLKSFFYPNFPIK